MAFDAEAAPAAELALSDTDVNLNRLEKTKFHIIGATLLTAQSALLHPTAVVKTRMQVAGSGLSHMRGLSVFCNILKSDVDVVTKVMKAEEFRGLYRGFGLTAVSQSPTSALWWGVYGAALHIIWRSLGYRDSMEKKPSHMEMVTVQTAAGMVADACSFVITTPVDTVKTRLQVLDNYGIGRPSVLKTTRALLREDGWLGFYRGFGPRFFNMSLYGTTIIVTYELIKRLSVKEKIVTS